MFVVGGESLIDLILQPAGDDGVPHLAVHAGGSPYNCALALAKLGQQTGFLSPMSADWLGDILIAPLDAAGVQLLLRDRVWEPTTLAAVKVDAEGKADYKFYRHADRALSLSTMLPALPEQVEFFQIGGFCPVEPEDAAIWMAIAEQARRRGATLSFDPNLRPRMVRDWIGYRDRLDAFFDLVHLVKISDDDLAVLDASLSIEQHAAALLQRPNCQLVVVTMGAKGSRAFSRNGEGRADIYSPPVFGDTVGAGDSLMAGIATILHERGELVPHRLGALDATALGEVLRFGAVVAGLNCAHKGCHPPTRPEVDAVLAG